MGPMALAVFIQIIYHNNMSHYKITPCGIKKGCWLALVFYFSCCSFLYAQEWAQMHKVLMRQGENMAKNGIKAQKELARTYAAIDAVAPFMHFSPQDILPWSFRVQARADNAFEQAAVLRNNRLELAARLLVDHAVRRMRAQHKEIQASLRYARSADLVSLIPSSAKFIFLGETHHQPVIEKQILYILARYHKRYPEKKIMLLTEFVLDTNVSLLPREMDERITSKRNFFNLLMKWRIPVFGLEEPLAHSQAAHEIFTEKTGTAFLSSTALAVRTRNQHWVKQIKAMHETYPDMVFFIYAGLGHTEYNLPASVAAAFPEKETFAIDFFVGRRSRFTPFDRAFGGLFSGPGVWYWKDAKYARLAGFDVSAVLPAGEVR